MFAAEAAAQVPDRTIRRKLIGNGLVAPLEGCDNSVTTEDAESLWSRRLFHQNA